MSANKGKKINIIDGLFIVLVAVAIIFAMVKFSTPGEKNANTSKITYTLEVKNAFPSLVSYVNEGDIVVDDDSMKEIGTVVDVRKEAATMTVQNDEKNTLEIKEIDDRVDVEIDVEAAGNAQTGNATVNSVNLLIGKNIQCIVGDAYVDAVIVGIDYEDATEAKEALAE